MDELGFSVCVLEFCTEYVAITPLPACKGSGATTVDILDRSKRAVLAVLSVPLPGTRTNDLTREHLLKDATIIHCKVKEQSPIDSIRGEEFISMIALFTIISSSLIYCLQCVY
ncbi:unnamed protein product [Meganyctiphanes norvegica]|uniref:Uncharacterized protein n=1 Tax=Meganyctiphanes norvegica TaxID=48144 RepID=A0AAV2QD42_MEGNR